LSVHGAADEVLAQVLLGQRRAARADPLDSEYYVRLPGDPRVWLVEGRLPDRDRALDWLETTLLRLDLARVQQVQVRHADGETVVVVRNSAEQADYRVKDLAPGERVESAHLVNNIANTMASLAFEDVQRAAGAPPPDTTAFEVELATFDGLVVRLAARTGSDATWVRLAAEGRPEPNSAPGPGVDVVAEAMALNQAWDGWEYAIAAYQIDALRKRRKELLAGPPPASGETGPSSSPPRG